VPGERTAALELHVASAPGRLDLRGGIPGRPAVLALAADAGGVPHLAHGTFDAQGRCSLPVDLERWHGRSFVAQAGTVLRGIDGRDVAAASHGLQVRVERAAVQELPAAAGGLAPDFSLLRIELPPKRGEAAWQQVQDGDFTGALATTLNSSGDTLLAKVGGKVMIPIVSVVSLGGSISFSVKIARDGEEYLVSVGQEVAVLCGVKATDDIGVEGGVSLGADEIYRFGSPGDVARGLRALALQQALPGVMNAARGENLARLQAARKLVQGLRSELARVDASRAARPFVRAAVRLALAAAEKTFAFGRRIGDRLEQAAGWLVTEAQFVRDAADGTEVRLARTGEVSLQVGKNNHVIGG
jgi:hypothetical protein